MEVSALNCDIYSSACIKKKNIAVAAVAVIVVLLSLPLMLGLTRVLVLRGRAGEI